MLQEIDLSVAGGDFICLLGAGGCGKTTLLNVAAGLIAAHAWLPWRTAQLSRGMRSRVAHTRALDAQTRTMQRDVLADRIVSKTKGCCGCTPAWRHLSKAEGRTS